MVECRCVCRGARLCAEWRCYVLVQLSIGRAIRAGAVHWANVRKLLPKCVLVGVLYLEMVEGVSTNLQRSKFGYVNAVTTIHGEFGLWWMFRRGVIGFAKYRAGSSWYQLAQAMAKCCQCGSLSLILFQCGKCSLVKVN